MRRVGIGADKKKTELEELKAENKKIMEVNAQAASKISELETIVMEKNAEIEKLQKEMEELKKTSTDKKAASKKEE